MTASSSSSFKLVFPDLNLRLAKIKRFEALRTSKFPRLCIHASFFLGYQIRKSQVFQRSFFDLNNLMRILR